MKGIDQAILVINKNICKNINVFDDSERGLLSQNILSELRNFVEYTSLKIASGGKDIEINYQNIDTANDYVKTKGKLKFLSKFHRLLQKAVSHYTHDEENSERLMLKYYEYLLKIKFFLKSNYNIDVLENISSFPIYLDPQLKEYYEKIAIEIDKPEPSREKSSYDDRYYIQKKKTIPFNEKIYYELTFTIANNKISKFDRVIAFTKHDIPENYAVKLNISNSVINIIGREMPIQIIDTWEVSIRPCELNNFAKLLGEEINIGSNYREYKDLMKYLTISYSNFVDILELSDKHYESLKSKITEKAEKTYFFNILDQCRDIVKNNLKGSNILRYLLYHLNNRVIKKQYNSSSCEYLSGLHLQFGCIPFDEMPFCTSPINHNPKFLDIYECIDPQGREYELFGRHIKNNIENRGKLYSDNESLNGFENIDQLIELYNQKLYKTHTHRKLEIYKKHIYIKGYEDDTIKIIEELKRLSSIGIQNYSNTISKWLENDDNNVDCEEKREALKIFFKESKVALVYGAAGTGKSTMINHLSNYFKDESKLYLANTNPAVANLDRKVSTLNGTFKTIASFLSNQNIDVDYDLLVIDECSTVSNQDMVRVLNKANFNSLVLVGDIYQIESILFGNWFDLVKSFVPENSVFELTKPYRSNNEKLLNLWSKVRNIEEDILEYIAKEQYSVTLDESIFDHSENDEIILCLNYDGLYGINNINKFLQSNNQNDVVEWGVHLYKAGDPILFNENNKFSPLIHNNMKGKIVEINKLDHEIQFDVEINEPINGTMARHYDFELLDNSDNGNTIIRFRVNKYKSTDYDDDSLDTIVPFQVAYAVSIHKAQGLEYNSVKIVITNEVEEMITHNIFYTAITRAKENLKIYWTPETCNKILRGFKKNSDKKDLNLLKQKYDY